MYIRTAFNPNNAIQGINKYIPTFSGFLTKFVEWITPYLAPAFYVFLFVIFFFWLLKWVWNKDIVGYKVKRYRR